MGGSGGGGGGGGGEWQDEDDDEAHAFDELRDLPGSVGYVGSVGSAGGAGSGGILVSAKASLSRQPSAKRPDPMGILIRLWYLEEGRDVNAGEIVGYTLIDHQMLANPAKGRRSYPISMGNPLVEGSMYDRDILSGRWDGSAVLRWYFAV